MPRLPPSSRRTKYPAEELAVRKEAHAFSQQVKAEHERRYEPRPAPPSRRAPNLSLDNHDRRRERSTHARAPHARSAPTSVAPATARQIIAAASSTAAQIPPVVASAPARITMTLMSSSSSPAPSEMTLIENLSFDLNSWVDHSSLACCLSTCLP